MIRALLLIGLLGAGAVLVAPTWEADEKTLTLRIRSGDEIEDALRGAARRLGAEVLDLAEGGEADAPSDEAATATPSVGAGPPVSVPEEVLRPDEAEELDELIEEALREE